MCVGGCVREKQACEPVRCPAGPKRSARGMLRARSDGGPAPMQDAAAPWQGCCIDPRLRLRVSLAGLLLPLLHLRV